MTRLGSKERFRLCVTHRQPDRPPIQYYATPEFDARLRTRLGNVEPIVALEVDFRHVSPRSTRAARQPASGSRVAAYDEFGVGYAMQRYEGGEYPEAYELPFAGMDTMEEVIAHPWPSADDWDYSGLGAAAEALGDRVVCYGSAGIPDMINGVSRGRGMERVLCDIVTEDEVGLAIIDRRVDYYHEWLRRGLEAARDRIDVVCLGEDLGTQNGPMVSLPVFDRFFRPRLQRFIDLAHFYGCRAMLHSCGSTRKLHSRFVEMGLDILDAMQPEPIGQDPEQIKRESGDRLTLCGLISTQRTLPFGTVDDCRAEAEHRVRVIGRDGGYIFAPAHCIQPDTPVDNVIAAYEVALGRPLFVP